LIETYIRDPDITDKLVTLFDKAAESLHVFHSLGFTHGDIKLENFVFDGSNVRIIDFGESYKHSVS
jgi:tRNA A-37 threonylcarbamoyl transferase component Bud32